MDQGRDKFLKFSEFFDKLIREGQQVNINDAAQGADTFIQFASIN